VRRTAQQAAALPTPLERAAALEWVARLRGERGDRDAALAELHELLLRAARYVVSQRRSSLPGVSRRELDEIAVEAAGDALLAILRRLDDFRGDSRFTTWAYKFAFLEAAAATRRRAWKRREIPHEDDDLAALVEAPRGIGRAEQAELQRVLRDAVERVLTPHQRLVFVSVCMRGVPIDVVAERLETTRGALYKTIHDARRKLRAHLAAAGFGTVTAPEPEQDAAPDGAPLLDSA
jgi:RNA polymerase sigma-70 factor, ECF subfamily